VQKAEYVFFVSFIRQRFFFFVFFFFFWGFFFCVFFLLPNLTYWCFLYLVSY